jgi:pimeloyl-ACP methyl ester carboxylesterase
MFQKDKLLNNDKAVQLLIFLPGMNRTTKNNYKPLFEKFNADQIFSDCDAIGYSFQNSYFSNVDPNRISEEIAKDLEIISTNYRNIILIGHSVGGLLVRKCLLLAIQERYRWPEKVNRLVLLSSANRGFVPRGFFQKLGLLALETIGRGKLLKSAQRGSNWINQLRIDWSESFNGKAPDVIQIRGDEDEFVEADDSADLMYYLNAYEEKLKGVNHRAFCGSQLPQEAIETIKKCFFCKFNKRKSKPSIPSMLIFLVHGIRDYAEWQEALAQEIAELDPKAMVIPVQYGYFNAFQFMFRLQRNRASRIFIDKYIQAILKYPKSKVAIAAHSNGTYAVAEAFQKHSFIKADILYLAGSVLPQNFNWTGMKIGSFRNDVANFDWPVGFLCKIIRIWDTKIGLAGFCGFTFMNSNNLYLKGSHGAALAPPYRSEIAKFLVTGQPTELNVQKAGENRLMSILSKLAVPFFFTIIAGIGYLYILIATTLSIPFAVMASILLTVLLIVGLSSL